MERHTHSGSYEGKRTKGTKIGTLWVDLRSMEGDVTVNLKFDGLDRVARIDVLEDIMGLLERELESQRNDRS